MSEKPKQRMSGKTIHQQRQTDLLLRESFFLVVIGSFTAHSPPKTRLSSSLILMMEGSSNMKVFDALTFGRSLCLGAMGSQSSPNQNIDPVDANIARNARS
jgi:hypothetical protein